MRCLSCKYDLRHLTEHRCPECGREFDPSDPTTFVAKADPVRRHARRVGLFAFLAIAGASIALVFLQSPGARGKDIPFLIIIFLAWCAIVAIGSFVLLK